MKEKAPSEEEIEELVAKRVKEALERQKEPKKKMGFPSLPFLSRKEKVPPPQELFPYLLAPSLVEIRPDRARFNEMLHRIIEATGYPRHVEDAWLYAFLSKNENYDISIHVEPLGISETLAYLHNQIIRQSSDLYQSQTTGTPNPSLEIKLADTKRLHEALYKGEEKIFRVSLYVDNKENSVVQRNISSPKKPNVHQAMARQGSGERARYSDSLKKVASPTETPSITTTLTSARTILPMNTDKL